MTTKTLTPTPAADLRPAPPVTYGHGDPRTEEPQVSPKRKDSGGKNQYGTPSDYRHRKTLDAFLRYVRLNRSVQTANYYKSKLRPLLRQWEALDPKDWTNHAFEEYVGLAQAAELPHQGGEPMGPRSIQMLLQGAKLFGEWCLTHGIPIPGDKDDGTLFWQGIKKPRNVRGELTGLLTLDQAKRVIEVAYNTKLEVAIALAVGCGFRKGEVERARHEDWREADGTILIRREKTHLHHRVKVPAFVQDILKRHGNDREGLMVGRLYNVPRSLKHLCEVAGVPRTHFHGFRHTWASEHIARGTPPSVVQRMGGWTSLSVLARYSHALGDSMGEAAARLG